MAVLFGQLISRDALWGAPGQGQQIATGQPERGGGFPKPAGGNKSRLFPSEHSELHLGRRWG